MNKLLFRHTPVMEDYMHIPLRRRKLERGAVFRDYLTGQEVHLEDPLSFTGSYSRPAQPPPAGVPLGGLRPGRNDFVLQGLKSPYQVALWTTTGIFVEVPRSDGTSTTYEGGEITAGRPFLPVASTGAPSAAPVQDRAPADMKNVSVKEYDLVGATVVGDFKASLNSKYYTKFTTYQPVHVVSVDEAGGGYRIWTDNANSPSFLLKDFHGQFLLKSKGAAIPRKLVAVNGELYAGKAVQRELYKKHFGTNNFHRNGFLDKSSVGLVYQGYSEKKESVKPGMVKRYVWWGPTPDKKDVSPVVGTGVLAEEKRWSEETHRFVTDRGSWDHKVYTGDPDYDEASGIGPAEKERDLNLSTFTGMTTGPQGVQFYEAGKPVSGKQHSPESWMAVVRGAYLEKEKEALAESIRRAHEAGAGFKDLDNGIPRVSGKPVPPGVRRAL